MDEHTESGGGLRATLRQPLLHVATVSAIKETGAVR
jgi:hypothetical protein